MRGRERAAHAEPSRSELHQAALCCAEPSRTSPRRSMRASSATALLGPSSSSSFPSTLSFPAHSPPHPSSSNQSENLPFPHYRTPARRQSTPIPLMQPVGSMCCSVRRRAPAPGRRWPVVVPAHGRPTARRRRPAGRRVVVVASTTAAAAAGGRRARGRPAAAGRRGAVACSEGGGQRAGERGPSVS